MLRVERRWGSISVLLGAGQLVGNLLGGVFAARWQMDGVLALTAILAVVSLVGASLMGSQARHSRAGAAQA